MMSMALEALHSHDSSLAAVDDADMRLTYGDLQRLVVAEERWLSSHGVRRCATLADNGWRWIVTDLALVASEISHVPIPAYFSAAQIRHLIADAEIEWILTDRPRELAAIIPGLLSVQVSPRTGLSLLRRALAIGSVDATEVGKITYTSGSTGTPKGVCLSQRALDRVARSLVDALAGLRVTRHMCVLPLPTLLENIAGVYAPLLLGAEIHVRPLGAIGMSYRQLDVPTFLRAIGAAEPSTLVLVPELLRVLLQANRAGWTPPSSLRFIAVGGSSVSPELLARAHSAGLPVFEGYGLSECSSVVCLNTPAHNKLGSVGRPLDHARVRIDSNGEICVSGATMLRYLGSSSPEQEEIRTGDLGEIDDDGFVYVRGRLKSMFITSMGRNVAPEWVERELMCEPAIAHAMVTGEARPYPVALIAGSQSAITSSAINDAIRRANDRLPDYAQVRYWMRFPEMPTSTNGLLTANGRLRRDETLARHRALIDSMYDDEDSLAYEIH